MDNIVKIDFRPLEMTPEKILDHAKGWDFESIVVIGYEKTSQTIIMTAKEQDDRALLEMSELLKQMYLQRKGWK